MTTFTSTIHALYPSQTCVYIYLLIEMITRFYLSIHDVPSIPLSRN